MCGAVRLGDKSIVQVRYEGKAFVSGIEIAALFIPEFRVSLLSVSQFDDSNLTTTFSDGTCHVSDSSGETLLEAPLVHGLYRFQASATLLMSGQRRNQRH